jgi:hypothetical protein
MFSSYCTDIIRVITVTNDKYGTPTESESGDIPARVEDDNKLLRDHEGKEVMPTMLVMFDFDNSVDSTYKIKIKKKHGQNYYQPNKKWEIKSFENLGMFGRTHVEVRI